MFLYFYIVKTHSFDISFVSDICMQERFKPITAIDIRIIVFWLPRAIAGRRGPTGPRGSRGPGQQRLTTTSGPRNEIETFKCPQNE